jgi:hypothetical protein
MANALIWSWVNAISRASSARLISALSCRRAATVALHHLHGVLGQLAGRSFLPAPVGVSDFRNDLAALLQRPARRLHRIPLQGGLDPDLDVVEIDDTAIFSFLPFVLPLNCRRFRQPVMPQRRPYEIHDRLSDAPG